MPKRCVFGCEPTEIPVHRFPSYEKYPERFKTWVTICGGKLESASYYENYRKKIVCDRHFTDNYRNRNKRLNSLAVPSLYLSGSQVYETITTMTEGLKADEAGQPSGHQPSTSATPASITGPEKADEAGQSSGHQPSTSDNTSGTLKYDVFGPVLKEHNYTAASRLKNLQAQKGPGCMPKFNGHQMNKMRTQIKRLRSEVCRLKKTRDLKKQLSNAQLLQKSIAFQQVLGRMAKPTQLFINMQLQASKTPKGRRFTIEEKVLSLSLYKKSPKCYALLHKLFTLPSAKAMKHLLGKIKLSPGINSVIYEKIKKSVAEKDIRKTV